MKKLIVLAMMLTILGTVIANFIFYQKRMYPIKLERQQLEQSLKNLKSQPDLVFEYYINAGLILLPQMRYYKINDKFYVVQLQAQPNVSPHARCFEITENEFFDMVHVLNRFNAMNIKYMKKKGPITWIADRDIEKPVPRPMDWASFGYDENGILMEYHGDKAASDSWDNRYLFWQGNQEKDIRPFADILKECKFDMNQSCAFDQDKVKKLLLDFNAISSYINAIQSKEGHAWGRSCDLLEFISGEVFMDKQTYNNPEWRTEEGRNKIMEEIKDKCSAWWKENKDEYLEEKK